MHLDWFRDACDLALGRACLSCYRPGSVLCGPCADGLGGHPLIGSLAGVPAVSCGSYDGLLREVILSYKERGTRALAPALGTLLATSVLCADSRTRGPDPGDRRLEPTLVVPIPGHKQPQRGFAALDDLCGHAHKALPPHLSVAPVLTLSRGYRPVKGQSRVARAESVSGSMRTTGLPPSARLAIVVDDVLTTGATVREGIRALAHAGVQTVAVAVIASPGMSGRRRALAPATHRPKGHR